MVDYVDQEFDGEPIITDEEVFPTEVPQDIVDAEYGESTYAEQGQATSLNEDDELPPYSIYARIFHADKPVKYQRLVCGHKFRHEFEPNHRNCERCFFTYFNLHRDLVKALDEGFQAGGPELIRRIKGSNYLHMWRKFMTTIAFVQAQQEAAKVKEQDDTSLDSSRQEHDAGVSSIPNS